MAYEIPLFRQTQTGSVQPENAAIFVRRGVPGQDAEAEIGERMAQRRQLPVQDGDHERLRRVKQHVAEAEMAMRDAGIAIGTGNGVAAAQDVLRMDTTRAPYRARAAAE